jgi:hypothetical protein
MGEQVKRQRPPQHQERQPGIESAMIPKAGQILHPNGGEVVNG